MYCIVFQECFVLNPAQMECPSPAVNREFVKGAHRPERSLPNKFHENRLFLKMGFIMDHVESVSDLEKHFKSLRSHLLYLEDPKFFEFPNDIKLYKGDTLVIEVCIRLMTNVHYMFSFTAFVCTFYTESL